MSINTPILRSFSYLNDQIVEDYISSILGGVPQEQTHTERLYSQAKASIKVLGSETGGESKKHETLAIPATSLFSSLYSDLKNMKMLKNPEKFVSEISSFKRGGLIEVEGIISPAGVDHVFKTFAKILQIPMFESQFSKRQLSDDQKIGFHFLKNYFGSIKKEKILVKFNPLIEPEFVLILQISPQFLRKGIKIEDLYNNEFKAMLRIKSVLSKTEKFDVFQFYGISLQNLPNSEKMIQQFVDAFKNPILSSFMGMEILKDDFYITAPALITEPIAIYI